MGLKAYFLPQVRSQKTGVPVMDILNSTIEGLGMGLPWSKATSYFSTLPPKFNVQPVIAAVDCVADADNRFKVYIRTQATDLSSLCDMLTLGGQLKGAAIDAMDPFESSSMVHSGATGLVDDWRTRVVSPYSTTSSQSLTLNLQTPNHNASPLSPMGATSVALMSMSSPLSLSVRFDISHHLSIGPKSVFQFEEAPSLPTFTLPRIVNGSKVFPKDLYPRRSLLGKRRPCGSGCVTVHRRQLL